MKTVIARIVLAPIALPILLVWLMCLPFLWALSVLDEDMPPFGWRDVLFPVFLFVGK